MNEEQDKIILIDPLTNNLIAVKDFNSICRVCLKKFNNLISITEYNIIKMITTCTSVQISLVDDLPKHLCQNCLNALQNAFNFKQLSEISDTNLRNILEENNLNKNFIIKTEPDEIDEAVENFNDGINNSIKIESEFVEISETKIQIESEELSPNKAIDNNEKPIDEERSHNLKSNFVVKIEPAEFSDDSAIENSDDNFNKSISTIKIENELCNEPSPIFENTDVKCNKKRSPNNKATISRDKSKTCHICNKKFSKVSNLKDHMAVHSDERPHQCSDCGKTFKLRNTLRNHKINWHTNEKRFECNKCDKKYGFLSALKQHIKSYHDDSSNACNICGKNFSSPHSLKIHSTTHKSERPYQCTECNKSYKSKQVLNWHKQFIHSPTGNHYEKVTCKICKRVFTKASFRKHAETHEINRKRIKCDKCSKEFLHQSSLQLHIRHEHENVPRIRKYICNICGHAVGSAAILKMHMLTHSDDKTYECNKCDVKYKSRTGLQHHIKTVHLNLKPYACTICSKRYPIPLYLRNHMRTHTGEQPFQCTICEKTFCLKDTLNKHIKLIHNKLKFNS